MSIDVVIKGIIRDNPHLSADQQEDLPYYFDTIELDFLRLKHTKIKRLPPEIGLLKNVRGMTFETSDIEYIPPEIGRCRLLEFIDFSETNLRRLPPEIGRLENLKTLFMRDTLVETLPSV